MHDEIENRSSWKTTLGGFSWGAGVLVSSLMTLRTIDELVTHGSRANLGWGALGLILIQPPATLAVVIGALVLWSAHHAPTHEHMASPASLGPYRVAPAPAPAKRSRTGLGWLLLAGVIWSCLAYVGLTFHNSGC